MGRIKRIGNKFYDTGTSNISFLQVAEDLRTLGIRNWYFMLEIIDYSLVRVDPFAVDALGNPTLTKDEITRVLTECKRNPWYYLREIVRIEDPGNPDGIRYKANRGNIAQAWCMIHGIDSWLCLPRQQGKTQSALAMFGWCFSFGTTNSTFIFINKDGENAKENLRRLGGQIDLLPKYMRFEKYIDDEGHVVKSSRNATSMKHPVTNNKIIIKSKATSRDMALSIARGLTAPILHFDEPEFTNHIKTITDNSVSTYDTAARHAKENGGMYCRVFTCTPGDLDTAMGLEAQYLLNATRPWTERFYDWTAEQIDEYIKSGESNHIVYIEYQYYQIGLTEAWLEEISAKINDPLVVRREILLQRLHGSSSSPYPKEDIEYLSDIQKKPIRSLWLLDFYEFFVYKEIDPGIPYIVGVDCSTGTNNDHNAITAINPYTMEPEMEFQCNYIGETLYEHVIIELVTKVMPRAIVCIERNSVGDGIIDHLLHSKIAHRLYYDKAKDLVADNMRGMETIESMLKKQAGDKKFYGVYTEGTSRESMFAILANHIANYKEKFITKFITEDISRLVRTGSGKIVAGPGFHDDNIMSYLIAMYVFYHGNNLPAFGFVPGSQEIKEKNQGIDHYSDAELGKVLPPEEIKAIKEQQKTTKIMDYESILRETLAKEQARSMSLATSSLHINSDTYNPLTDVSPYDDESEIPLSLFNDWNS